jgi:hypothetical protein
VIAPAISLFALLASAQSEPRSVRSCQCPGQSSTFTLEDSDPRTCASACGGSTGRRAAPGPDWGAINAANERAEQARVESERRQQAERDRLAAERRKFEEAKSEGLRSLKGLSPDAGGLKGLGDENPSGLKGLGESAGETGLKGVAEIESGPRECRIVDSCTEALGVQTRALESARDDQSDLYRAMGSVELDQAKGVIENGVKDSAAGRVAIFVWKTKEQAGLPRFQRDYKETIEQTLALMEKKSLSGPAGEAAKKLKALKAKAQTLIGFAKYMQALKHCASLPYSSYNRCVDDARNNFSKALDGLPLDSTTVARVKAASDAYTRYSTKALDRAFAASTEASKCFKGCRRQ